MSDHDQQNHGVPVVIHFHTWGKCREIRARRPGLWAYVVNAIGDVYDWYNDY